jgi:hypothetical protein
MTKRTTEPDGRPWGVERLGPDPGDSISITLPIGYPEKALHYLRAHSGCVVTREELAREVWDLHLDRRSRTIDQTISAARKRLSPHERFVSVPRQGYRHGRDDSPEN